MSYHFTSSVNIIKSFQNSLYAAAKFLQKYSTKPQTALAKEINTLFPHPNVQRAQVPLTGVLFFTS